MHCILIDLNSRCFQQKEIDVETEDDFFLLLSNSISQLRKSWTSIPGRKVGFSISNCRTTSVVFSQLLAMGATLFYNRKVMLLFKFLLLKLLVVKVLLVKVLLVKLLLVKVCMAHNGYEDEFPLVVLHQLEACGGNLW